MPQKNKKWVRYGAVPVLYYASFGGLSNAVEQLLSKGADVNAQGGFYGNAVQVASFKDHDKIVELLLSKGADVNSQGGKYGNALQAASSVALIEISPFIC
ncbi:Myotrophin [Dactylellina cionopaga]|nr:Myotrophin [Dactylellina cionopaga]